MTHGPVAGVALAHGLACGSSQAGEGGEQAGPVQQLLGVCGIAGRYAAEHSRDARASMWGSGVVDGYGCGGALGAGLGVVGCVDGGIGATGGASWLGGDVAAEEEEGYCVPVRLLLLASDVEVLTNPKYR